MQGSVNEDWRDHGELPTHVTKPAWSVRSVENLNEAIRQNQRPDSPWRLHEEASRAKVEKARLKQAHAARIEAAARAHRNRHRNPWENT